MTDCSVRFNLWSSHRLRWHSQQLCLELPHGPACRDLDRSTKRMAVVPDCMGELLNEILVKPLPREEGVK